MTRSFKKPKDDSAKPNFVAFVNIDVRKRRARASAEINFRARAFRQLAMAAHKIGVQMSLDNMFDLQSLRGRLVDIKRNIALRIHHHGDAFGAEHVRSMRKTG